MKRVKTLACSALLGVLAGTVSAMEDRLVPLDVAADVAALSYQFDRCGALFGSMLRLPGANPFESAAQRARARIATEVFEIAAIYTEAIGAVPESLDHRWRSALLLLEDLYDEMMTSNFARTGNHLGMNGTVRRDFAFCIALMEKAER